MPEWAVEIGRLFREFHKLPLSEITVLDVGCGIGLYKGVPYKESEYLYYEGNPIGIDPLPQKIKTGKFIRGTGEHIPICSETVDVVLSVSSMDHMLGPKKFVLEAHRVLKKGGSLFVALGIRRSIIHFWQPTEEEFKNFFSPPFRVEKFECHSIMSFLKVVKC